MNTLYKHAMQRMTGSLGFGKHPFLAVLFLSIVFPYIVHSQGGIQVDLTTGRANMSVPFWTIQSKDIRHPIGISYSTAGFKVGTPIGKAGLGWSLTAGGSITRQLRGLPDDFEDSQRKGWLKASSGSSTESFVALADDNWTTADDEATDYTNIQAFGGYGGSGSILDTEPDIFYINVAGLGGSFILNHDGSIKSTPHNDYVIAPGYDTNGALNMFSVTNSLGVTYRFELADEQTIQALKNPNGGPLMLDVRNYYSYQNPVTFRNTWYLTEVTSAQGGRLTFEYAPVTHSDLASSYRVNSWIPERQDTLKTYRWNAGSNQYQEHWEYYLNVEETRPYDLTRIISTTGMVSFSQGDVLLPSSFLTTVPYLRRMNVKMKKPLLSKVTIHELSKEGVVDSYAYKHSFVLNYDFASLVDNPNTHQVFLKSISRVGREQEALELFNFSYDGITFGNPAFIPPSYSWAKDNFGYFNGTIPNKLLKTYMHPNGSNPYQMVTYPVAGEETFVLDGREGLPNLRGLLVGTLATVANRLGGTTSVTYELNQAYDAVVGEDVYAGGLRVQQVRMHDGMDRANDQVFHYEYKQPNDRSSGIFLHQPTYAFNVGIGWDFSTQQPVYYQDLLDQGLTKEELWKRTTFRTERDVRYEAQEGAAVVYERVTVRQEGKGRTVYQYDWPIANQTLSASGWSSPKSKIARQSLPSHTYRPIGSLSLYQAYPHGPSPKPNHLQGLLSNVSVYDEQGNREQETINHYQFLSSDPVQALRIGQLPVLASNGGVDVDEKMFVYRVYEMQTGNMPLLSQSVTRSFDAIDQTKWQTLTTDYLYPSSAAPYPSYPTHQFTTDSRGIKRGVKYKYPFNFNTPSPGGNMDDATRAIVELREKNVLSMPLEVTQTYEEPGDTEKILGGSLSEYRFVTPQNVIRAHKQYTLRVDAPIDNFQAASILGSSNYTLELDSRYELQSEVTLRDQWGNAVTQEGISKVPVTTLSALEGSLRLAMFSHASYPQVAYESFEERDLENQGGFVHAASFVDGRISGQGLSLGASDQLTKQLKREGANEFVVSFWVNTPNTGTLTVFCTQGANTAMETIGFVSSNAVWTYYEAKLDLSGLGNEFDLGITTSSAVDIDDVSVYPAYATISYPTYDEGLFIVAETSNGGITTTRHLDNLNRTWHRKNHKGEVTSVTRFPTGNQNLPNHFANIGSPSFAVEPGEVVEFNQLNPVDAAQYSWIVGTTGINYRNPSSLNFPSPTAGGFGGDTHQHTFSSAGTYVVVLKATFDGKTSYDTKLVEVATPVTVDICIDGIVFYNTCPGATVSDHWRTSCPSISSGSLETKFLASLSGATATSYQWQTKADVPGSVWQNVSSIPGLPNQYSIFTYGSNNILVRCIIQTTSETYISPTQEIYVAEQSDCQTTDLN